MNMHTQTYTHICTCIYIHIQTPTAIHTYKDTNQQTHTGRDTYICNPHIHTNRTYIKINIHNDRETDRNIQTQTYKNTYGYTETYIQIYSHTDKQRQIHIYTYTYIHNKKEHNKKQGAK